ncbi:alginate O-acetyltransferase AlgX-related protein [Desulfolutivibrio sp.]|uniref:alginate O-acetyltransferase AlgX-related protein n=1 Tax=Desulfolutivibrio sp. TaxID=2773296 RepID=UPI002F96C856
MLAPIFPSRVRLATTILSIVIFSALILAPGASELLRRGRVTAVAESGMEGLPPLDAAPADWVRVFNALRGGYLEKHFGLRGRLITWYNYVNAFLLKSSQDNNPVVMGRDRWLFLSQDGPDRNILEDFRTTRPLPEAKMRRVLEVLTARRDWCAARGIAYLVVVAPNKNTVYPEKLPEAFTRPVEDSHLDQLLRYLADHAALDVVDLRPALAAAKKEHQVFYAMDSHWNAHGAFAAYREIMRHVMPLFPNIRPFGPGDYTPVEYAGLPGDLAFLLGLQDYLPEARVLYVNAAGGARARGTSYPASTHPGYFQPLVASEVTGPVGEGLPRAVFFHDSFFWELLPFLAEHFRFAVYAWMNPQTEMEPRYFDTELIERERANIVVEEFTERYFVPSARPLQKREPTAASGD